MSPAEKRSKPKKESETISRRDPSLYDHFDQSEYLENKFERYLREFTFPKKELFQIRKAFDFAKLAHQNQLRDDAYPFILHPVRVANILLHELKNTNADVICGSLLHDVIEHCPVTLKELRNNFNDNVASFVKALTKASGPTVAKTDHFSLILRSAPEIQLIKLCDRLDNCRALRFSQNRVKIRRYIKDLKFQYIPLSQRVSPYLYHEMITEQTVLQNRLRGLQRKAGTK